MTVTEQDFINFYIRAGCTGMSVAQIAQAVLREYKLSPRGVAATPQELTGIEAADLLTDYLKLRTKELDAGDAANIVHFLHDRGLLRLRYPDAAQAPPPPRPDPSVPFKKG